MTSLAAKLTGIQTRTVALRTVDPETRQVVGLAVPWDTETNLGWVTEIIKRGAVSEDAAPLLFWEHREPIGKIRECSDTDGGLEITGVISKTPRGDEAYQLAQDGVITGLSIGFTIDEYEETLRKEQPPLITVTKLSLMEVSLCAFPAYDDARISQTRNNLPSKGPVMDTQTIEPNTELETRMTDLERRLDQQAALPARLARPQWRTAGEWLKDLARGSEAALAVTQQTRAFTGGVYADTAGPETFLGDLTKLVEQPLGMTKAFGTAALPATGMTLEYSQVKSNSMTVGKQVKEGDALPTGKLTWELKSAPVETYGGGGWLSRTTIERAPISVLDTTLRALAIEARRQKIAAFRAFFEAQVAAQATAGNTLTVDSISDWKTWTGLIVNASEKLEEIGLTLDSIIVSGKVFKELANAIIESESLVLPRSQDQEKTLGTLDAKSRTGNILGVELIYDSKLTGDYPVFVSRQALLQYTSPVVSLSDQDISTLTSNFSVYHYAAFAAEYPAGIIPVGPVPGE
ncbi:MAG: HK97 family phage prohead protease [Bifidobacteriaceae bacterium]|jgi:HK97 family phage prohead protease|nr:HK97 family phage prohead protease [Bifidobacteriaceae bacterium]